MRTRPIACVLAVAAALLTVDVLPVLAAPGACMLTCPANQIVLGASISGACGATVTYSPPTTTGTCGPVLCTPASGSTFQEGETAVTCTDGVSMASCGFKITVVPGPAVTCRDQTIELELPVGAPLRVDYDLPTAVGCYPATSFCTPPPGSVFEPGTTEVSCVTRDTQGNQAPCKQFITASGIQVGAPLAGAVGLGTLGAALVAFGLRALRRRAA